MLASDVVIVLAADRLELGSSFALINPHETTEIIDLSSCLPEK